MTLPPQREPQIPQRDRQHHQDPSGGDPSRTLIDDLEGENLGISPILDRFEVEGTADDETFGDVFSVLDEV